MRATGHALVVLYSHLLVTVIAVRLHSGLIGLFSEPS
jgi:hypothetical protein